MIDNFAEKTDLAEVKPEAKKENQDQHELRMVNAFRKWLQEQGINTSRKLGEMTRRQYQTESGKIYNIVIPGMALIVSSPQEKEEKLEIILDHNKTGRKIVYTSYIPRGPVSADVFKHHGIKLQFTPVEATTIDSLIEAERILQSLQTAKRID